MNLKEIAKSMASVPAMDGKTKVDTAEIVNKEISIDHYDFCNSGKENGRYVVVNFKELPDRYYFGGTALTEIFEKFEEKYDHDDINTELSNNPLKISLSTVKTRNGNNFVKVSVLD